MVNLTPELQAVLDRYGVTVRDGPQVVWHPAYGVKTAVSALMFAVYEAAVKAQWTNMWWAERQPPPPNMAVIGMEGWRDRLDDVAKLNGIVIKGDPQATGEQSGRDYHWLAGIITDADLYMELLD